MTHAIEPTEAAPLIRLRTHAEWQQEVLEMEAEPTGLDSDLFAFWIRGRRLTPHSAAKVATVAKMFEVLTCNDNPDFAPYYVILAALTFADKLTKDVLKDRPELAVTRRNM
jgi:hypothetical protein